jgi:hypothetical protein
VTPDTFLATALRPAFFLLPQRMNTPEAQAMLVAIALHESKLEKRRQMSKGPARSYLQFEKVGVRGVLRHKASAPHAKAVCGLLDIPASVPAVHRAMEFSDVLAVCFGRLLLWRLPFALPTAGEPGEGYTQYLQAWNPNRQKAALRKAEWLGNYTRAWALIRGNS